MHRFFSHFFVPYNLLCEMRMRCIKLVFIYNFLPNITRQRAKRNSTVCSNLCRALIKCALLSMITYSGNLQKIIIRKLTWFHFTDFFLPRVLFKIKCCYVRILLSSMLKLFVIAVVLDITQPLITLVECVQTLKLCARTHVLCSNSNSSTYICVRINKITHCYWKTANKDSAIWDLEQEKWNRE